MTHQRNASRVSRRQPTATSNPGSESVEIDTTYLERGRFGGQPGTTSDRSSPCKAFHTRADYGVFCPIQPQDIPSYETGRAITKGDVAADVLQRPLSRGTL